MRFRTLRSVAFAIVLLGLGGCANTPANDPIEPFNRQVYRFNKAADKAVIKPVAEAYKNVVPSPVRTGVHNFLSNLDDVVVLANDLLQFKLMQGASDASRLLVNTTFGILGLFDVATPAGLPKHDEDLGQTLGYWGIGPGFYVMLPILGPSDLRDSIGRLGDGQIDPIWQQKDMATRNQLVVTDTVDRRTELLSTSEVLDTAALDEYSMLRDGYLQRRQSLIYDGNPPLPKYDDE